MSIRPIRQRCVGCFSTQSVARATTTMLLAGTNCSSWIHTRCPSAPSSLHDRPIIQQKQDRRPGRGGTSGHAVQILHTLIKAAASPPRGAVFDAAASTRAGRAASGRSPRGARLPTAADAEGATSLTIHAPDPSRGPLESVVRSAALLQFGKAALRAAKRCRPWPPSAP